MSWTNPVNQIDYEIAKALKTNKPIVVIATKSKAIPKRSRKKRARKKREITVFKIDKKGRIRPKKVKVDQETFRLIKQNQDYKPKAKKIWLPKSIRSDLMIKRIFS